MSHIPEILAPVGDFEMARAAVSSGAGSVYVGAPFFNARGRSKDFSIEELRDLVELCHSNEVKVYIAFNVLIFQKELEPATELLKQILDLNVDAVIVQDIGLVRIINALAPRQRVHASTQMSVSNFEAIRILEDLNIERFVLSRECSLPEISLIKQNTAKEIEVFVHGALCVSYSGQCFTSEVIGGRSANRGQCAQSCRLGYELEVDGKPLDHSKKYVLSPHDFCGIDDVPELAKIKVDALKIEGRLKTPYYVAAVTSAYKKAANNLMPLKSEIDDMAVTYSRGFYPGWLHGVEHQKLVSGTYSKHRGLQIGEVTALNQEKIEIHSKRSLHQGDGLLFISADTKEEIGGQIHQVVNSPDKANIFLGRQFPYHKISRGALVFLNRDQQLFQRLDEQIKALPVKRKNLFIEVITQIDQPLRLKVQYQGNALEIESTDKLQQAKTLGLTKEIIQNELSKLDRSPYHLATLSWQGDANCFFSQKSLKEVRQKMVEVLDNFFETKKYSITSPDFDLVELITNNQKASIEKKVEAKLNILLRNREQLTALLDFIKKEKDLSSAIGILILDYEFGHQYSDSINEARAITSSSGIKTAIATTRILKPLQYQNLKQIEKADPDAILIRNLGALDYFYGKGKTLMGDFSLNITNSLTFDYLINKNFDSLCLSYDLNEEQLFDLLSSINSRRAEITIHQYMPEFHMEYCVFAAMLSKGSSYKDCGHPCEKHQVILTDQNGIQHKIKADHECRNTLFSAQSQSALGLLQKFTDAGCRFFRFEALDEQPQELLEKLSLYLRVLQGKLTPTGALGTLTSIEKYGLSTGNLGHRHLYKSRKK